MSDPVWRMKGGRVILIKDMSDSYLRNVKRMLEDWYEDSVRRAQAEGRPPVKGGPEGMTPVYKDIVSEYNNRGLDEEIEEYKEGMVPWWDKGGWHE